MVKYNLLLELNNILAKMEKHCDEMMEKYKCKESGACTNCEFANYGRYLESGCVYVDIESFGIYDMVKRIIEKNKEKIDLERKLKYPAIYKHFKGGFYVVMGVSKAVTGDELDKIFKNIGCINRLDVLEYRFGSRHTETKENVIIYRDNKGNLYHYKDVDNNTNLVIYKTLYDGTGAYARPIEMFLSKVDKEKYPSVVQEYRFEEV
ncbi:DUF1653 domain-containing protein [Clostridioides sp. ZZV14-6345]|uniref:DUF1653 domain-containing protein n=1 Tax=Clostridioides sp. ZZV14-6345 TaxID=2811496 RepID=UPI001D12F389